MYASFEMCFGYIHINNLHSNTTTAKFIRKRAYICVRLHNYIHIYIPHNKNREYISFSLSLSC